MEADAVLVWEQACGGGYGDPFERDPEAVLHDWMRGARVSAESAERDYGVVIDATHEERRHRGDRAVAARVAERGGAHVRIKYIVPFPFDEVGLANRAAQLPDELRTPGVDYDFVPVKNSCKNADSAYELLLLDAYIAEAGLASEDEGYDAVVMDTVSDSGLAALRSRLTIPVLGPGQAQQHVAAMLGKKFSILTMWERWRPLYEKTMTEYGTAHHCASIRSIGKRPDQEQLLAGREDIVFEALEREGRAAIEEDHADVILIGSTTMHQSVDHLRRTLGVPVINPGTLTIKLAELFVTLGLTHSKAAYMAPEVLQDEKLNSLMGV